MKKALHVGVSMLVIGGSVATFLSRQEAWAKKNGKPVLPVSVGVFDLSVVMALTGAATVIAAKIWMVISPK